MAWDDIRKILDPSAPLYGNLDFGLFSWENLQNALINSQLASTGGLNFQSPYFPTSLDSRNSKVSSYNQPNYNVPELNLSVPSFSYLSFVENLEKERRINLSLRNNIISALKNKETSYVPGYDYQNPTFNHSVNFDNIPLLLQDNNISYSDIGGDIAQHYGINTNGNYISSNKKINQNLFRAAFDSDDDYNNYMGTWFSSNDKNQVKSLQLDINSKLKTTISNRDALKGINASGLDALAMTSQGRELLEGFSRVDDEGKYEDLLSKAREIQSGPGFVEDVSNLALQMINNTGSVYNSLGLVGDTALNIGRAASYMFKDRTFDFSDKVHDVNVGDIIGRTTTGVHTGINAVKNLGSINQAVSRTRQAAESAAEAAGKSADEIKKAGDTAVGNMKGVGTAKAGNAMALVGAAAGVADAFLGERDEYSGDKGNITQTLDQVYDGISDAAMSMGPIGMIVGGAMKGADLLGDGLAKLGGGTDGMTTADAILGSSFFSWNVGLINGFGGSTTDTITKDEDVFAQVGSSYGGTNAMVDDAVHKSGKKYGLFSKKLFNKAQELIQESKRLQQIMTNIASNAKDRFAIQDAMSAVNKNKYQFNLQGGYNQASVRAGKHGMLISNIIKELSVDDYFEPISIREIFVDDIEEFKEGGVIKEIEISNNIIEVDIESYLIPEFQKGGLFNIIPEGALHARLHHMDNAEKLTKKGIPVVAENENGELEQLAEIEREEIIFRLDVTLKIESLYRKYKSEEYTLKEKDLFAIEVGKLLTHEILNKTIDYTKNLI